MAVITIAAPRRRNQPPYAVAARLRRRGLAAAGAPRNDKGKYTPPALRMSLARPPASTSAALLLFAGVAPG